MVLRSHLLEVLTSLPKLDLFQPSLVPVKLLGFLDDMVEMFLETAMELELTSRIQRFSRITNYLTRGSIGGTTIMTGMNNMGTGKQIGTFQSHDLLAVPKLDTIMKSRIRRWTSQLPMLCKLTDNGIPSTTTLATHMVLQMSIL